MSVINLQYLFVCVMTLHAATLCLQVALLKTLTMEEYFFECGRWLDINEDDNEIVRELPATGALIEDPLPCERHTGGHT